jgi:hypothetical protein
MPMKVMERIQVIWFSVQETTISLMYVWFTRDFLKDTYSHQTHRVMLLLISAQVVGFIFDVALIAVDCNNMFTLKVIIHPFAYAVKLKFEFIVLNQLLALIKHGVAPSSFPAPDEESPDASKPTPQRSNNLFNKHVSSVDTERTAIEARANGTDMSRKDSLVLPSGVLSRDMEYYESKNGVAKVSAHEAVDRVDQELNQLAVRRASIPTDPDTIEPILPHESTSISAVSGAPAVYVAPASSGRHSFEPHMPARSMSDPTPLVATQHDHESDTGSSVAEIARQYLGNWRG